MQTLSNDMLPNLRGFGPRVHLGCVTSAYIPVRFVTGHHTSCQQKIPVLGNVPVRMHRYIGIVDAEVVQLTENLGNSRS